MSFRLRCNTHDRDSPLPLAYISPSGLNSTQCTGPWCPLRTSRSSPSMPCTRTHSSHELPATKRSKSIGWIDADDGGYGRSRLCMYAVSVGDAGMNATARPEVATRRFVVGESSMEVMGSGNLTHLQIVQVRRSHHLQERK